MLEGAQRDLQDALRRRSAKKKAEAKAKKPEKVVAKKKLSALDVLLQIRDALRNKPGGTAEVAFEILERDTDGNVKTFKVKE